jgi:plasmid stabilization system protein ParE
MTTDLPEHPATVHLRSVALVRHLARGDHEAAAALLADLNGPQAAAAQILSLAGLCRLLLAEMPEDTAAPLLEEAALAQAQSEDQ